MTRRVVGIAGPPGSGKSTVAERLVRALGPAAVLVPMDGFHRYQDELVRLGRADRKGAPDTFDAAGFAALVDAIRSEPERVHRAPVFDRGLDDPVPDAIEVTPSHDVVVVEGNYLLYDADGWGVVAASFDRTYYVDVDDATRVERLIARHVAYGKRPTEAREWVLRSDEANARLVASTRARADAVIGPDVEVRRLADEIVPGREPDAPRTRS